MGKEKSVGYIAFLVGFAGAVLAAVLSFFDIWALDGTMVSTVLLIAGVLIGLMNVSKKERKGFMLSALVIGGSSGIMASLPFVGGFVKAVINNLAFVALPAAIVSAVIYLWNTAN